MQGQHTHTSAKYTGALAYAHAHAPEKDYSTLENAPFVSRVCNFNY